MLKHPTNRYERRKINRIKTFGKDNGSLKKVEQKRLEDESKEFQIRQIDEEPLE